jgi:hypothetical protein
MPRLPARAMACFLAASLFLSPRAFAFEIPLETHSVRDGYFFGQRGDEKLARFLDTYSKHLSSPPAGAYISEITLLTPYAQVVDISRQKTLGYSAQQAEQDYKRRGDSLRVYVRIEFTATYGFLQAVESANKAAREQRLVLQPFDFWRDFQFLLSQDAKPTGLREADSDATSGSLLARRIVDAEETGASAIYGDDGLTGALVWLDYDAKNVTSDSISFEVTTPTGGHAVASFDLARLR